MRTPVSSNLIDQLPRPDAAALAHSEACADLLRSRIRANGDWLSFAQYMQIALYAPGLGYYAAGARKFGAAGDFITAPEISPLFAQCIASSIAPALAETNGALLELGPGSGKLAGELLRELEALGSLPSKYLLLEVSADLRQRQRQALDRLPAHLRGRCEWVESLPTDFDGAIIANEVLDVVPIHLLRLACGRLFERGVALDGERFVWHDSTELPAALRAIAVPVATELFAHAATEDYVTEFAPAVTALVASLVESLRRGVLLLIDYGFRRQEFYHPSRRSGTLMCHYRHYAHTDPFLYPGLTDITAHVDFTAVAESGLAAGATLEGYCTQAQFLMATGITERIAALDPDDAARYLAVTTAAQRLLSPAEMGEFFKVIGFGRGGVGIPALICARPLSL